MPKVRVNDITMNYEQQGTGEPLILIPYLAADNACYAFQVADYAKQFTCISIDPRGAGETDKPAGNYSTELSRTSMPTLAFADHSGRRRLIFESCSDAPIYESVSEFNQKTLSFLSRHAG